jgi:hypothetical protein
MRLTVTTLADLLNAVREEDSGSDAEEMTKALLDRLFELPDAKFIVYPAVLQYVQQAERNRVREMEKLAYSGAKSKRTLGYQNPDGTLIDGPPVTTYTNPAEEAMRRLLSQTVYVPGEGRVQWGDMTVELHQRRVIFLEGKLQQHIEGQRETISRHQQAVTYLNDSNCGTLREYAEQFGTVPVEAPQD